MTLQSPISEVTLYAKLSPHLPILSKRLILEYPKTTRMRGSKLSRVVLRSV